MEPIYKNLGKVRPTIDNNNWSIDNKYDLLTIVYDPSSNKSYISRKDVPANVIIDNREYWLPFGVGKFVDNAIININYLDGISQKLVTYSLKEAIARISNEDKRLGVIISFYGNEANDSHIPGWCLYQFMSNDLNDWDNINAWNSIYYNKNKNVGWFRTESELLTIYPYPHKGDYCYMGTSLISSYVYRCYENGTWINTHELASANIGITVGGNIHISENGTWIVDDEDTGIKAVGTGIEKITYNPSQEDGGINILHVKLTDGAQFSFPIKNGNQGNSGIVVPNLETFLAELVNNLTTDDATKALSAAQGVILNNKINRLDQELDKCSYEDNAEVNADLEIADPNGKVLARFSDGHFKTKNFDSRNSGGGTIEDYIYGDFAIVDQENNCLLKLSEGHLKTKNFDSKNVAINYKNPYSEEIIRFEIEVNVNMLKDVNSTADLTDSQMLYTDKGLLMLPDTYTPKGAPTRLVIACHGAGGGVSDHDSQIENQTLYKYLVANGYAVMDMQGMPSSWVETWWSDYESYGLPAAKKEYVKVNNMGCPLTIECYIKGYQWVIEHYNIAKDGVFIAGASMGGLSSMNLVLTQKLPIIAHAVFAPALDTYNQAFLHPWTDGVSKYTLSKLYNFEVDTNNEFIYDLTKVCGYNPIINKMQTYHEGVRIDSVGVYSFSNGTLNGQTIKEYHGYPCPLKIWHCVNDGTVNIACSVRLINAIKNYGGSAWLRRFPTGGHAPDTAGTVINNPIGNTILHGVSVGAIYPAAEELLLYFNRYNNFNQ